MTWQKRIFDIVLVLALSVVLVPVIALISLLLMWQGGGPVFYRAERMKTVDEGFILWKFRTMQCRASNIGVTGGEKLSQITRSGRWLRRYRLDELPQLLNILRGDISFVGPRPPLRYYTERFPKLYAQVLTCRPGVTGLATLHIHQYEARVLAECSNADETDKVYVTRCLPRKARLDLIYQNHRGLCFDGLIILKTIQRVFGR